MGTAKRIRYEVDFPPSFSLGPFEPVGKSHNRLKSPTLGNRHFGKRASNLNSAIMSCHEAQVFIGWGLVLQVGSQHR